MRSQPFSPRKAKINQLESRIGNREFFKRRASKDQPYFSLDQEKQEKYEIFCSMLGSSNNSYELRKEFINQLQIPKNVFLPRYQEIKQMMKPSKQQIKEVEINPLLQNHNYSVEESPTFKQKKERQIRGDGEFSMYLSEPETTEKRIRPKMSELKKFLHQNSPQYRELKNQIDCQDYANRLKIRKANRFLSPGESILKTQLLKIRNSLGYSQNLLQRKIIEKLASQTTPSSPHREDPTYSLEEKKTRKQTNFSIVDQDFIKNEILQTNMSNEESKLIYSPRLTQLPSKEPRTSRAPRRAIFNSFDISQQDQSKHLSPQVSKLEDELLLSSKTQDEKQFDVQIIGDVEVFNPSQSFYSKPSESLKQNLVQKYKNVFNQPLLQDVEVPQSRHSLILGKSKQLSQRLGYEQIKRQMNEKLANAKPVLKKKKPQGEVPKSVAIEQRIQIEKAKELMLKNRRQVILSKRSNKELSKFQANSDLDILDIGSVGIKQNSSGRQSRKVSKNF